MTAPAAVVRVVDDDAAYRTALKRLLEAVGFGVRTYGSAGEFLLDETEQAQPGCLLLDLRTVFENQEEDIVRAFETL